MDIIFPVSDENCGADTSIAQVLTTCNTEPALRVVVCGEKDFSQNVLCAPDGTPVAVQTVWDHDTNTNVTYYYDLVLGATWIGVAADLTACPDIDVESDPQEMCDSGVSFVRWVVKQNGQPTGVTYDTDLNAVAYTPVGTVTFGACGLKLTDFADVCVETQTSCSAPVDVANYYTATNPSVRFDVTDLGGGVFHVGVEDGAFTGAFGLFSTNYATSDFTRLFDDTFFTGSGVQLWNGAISSITSLLGGRRIEFDFDSNARPGGACDTVVAPLSTAAATLFASTVGGVTNFVAFLSQNFVLSTSTSTVDVLRVKEFCKPTYDVLAPVCAGTVPVTVDSVTATYVMNPECPTPAVTLKSGGVSIANGVYAGLLGPNGSSWVAPANLKSVTVRARKGTSGDAVPGNPNQVLVTTSGLQFVVLLNESWTWDVEDGNVLGFPTVDIVGDAAAGIVWVEG